LYAPAGTPDPAETPTERQHREQQAALLTKACDLDLRTQAVLSLTLTDFIDNTQAAPAAGPGASSSEDKAAEKLHAEAARCVAQALCPLVARLLVGVLQLSDKQFVVHLPELFPRLVELMSCEDKEVRYVLHQIFSQRSSVFVGQAAHQHESGKRRGSSGHY